MVIEVLIPVMNRLTPLIDRRPRAAYPAPRYAAPRAAAATAAAAPAPSSDDLRMFATTFLGGLDYFGTLIA